MSSHLQNPIFQDEEKARAWFEARIWPNGPFCPHCGEYERVTRLHGKAHRPGVFQCNSCREQFTVTVNTVCERFKIPLTKWLLAIYLLNSSKNGMSALQLHRTLGGSYKTAWFLCHRIREAMREDKLGPLGGEGKFVETYTGGKAKNRAYRPPPPKEAVMSLVERGGKVRSFHVPEVTAVTLKPIIVDAIAKDTHFRTDESGVYWEVGAQFASHRTVVHSIGEYVRGDAHTNTIFKRGIYVVYPPCEPGTFEALSLRIRLPLQLPFSAGLLRYSTH